MAAPHASSRLELLQARFQQKQLQEKEQKLLQLYDQQQQRAYQVVQRGSAGSNSSNATSIGHRAVTKTSSSSHTTSTSQGGKVRQMFDERRHTTVKGIDRSYPLEPLENKPRKQANGNGTQKNGVLTVNRQSVTVKRMTRADVNSNLNGGKPVVSYHEEITRESFGPAAREQPDEDEFGNENHVAQYANGNHRGEPHIEEILDDDTIERNRMMAKLHLMEYDETLKHRVKNDLESEEFPEDVMLNIPDKLPKQNVTKKLSQAEVRLKRFKNANAKRNNSVAKNQITVPKKRSEPVLPPKATYREDRSTSKREVSDRGSSKSPGSGRAKTRTRGSAEETTSSLDSSFFCEENERSATTYAIDSKSQGKLSMETLTQRTRRNSPSPPVYSEESDKSSTIRGMRGIRDTSASRKNINEPDEGPKFFCRESEKSATTYAIDAAISKSLSEELGRDPSGRNVSPRLFTKDTKTARRFTTESDRSTEKRETSKSPKFFSKETDKPVTTRLVDSKTVKRLSPDVASVRKARSQSPKFFCRESEKSATTYAIDSISKETEKPVATRLADSQTLKRLSPDVASVRKARSQSPKFFCKESDKSATTYLYDSKAAQKLSSESLKTRQPRSRSPEFFCRESEKSATTYAIDSISKKANTPLADLKTVKRLSPYLASVRKVRSQSPKFFCKESDKSTTTYLYDSKAAQKLSSKSLKTRQPRSRSPEFFCRESEKSATTYAIDSRNRAASPGLVKSIKPTMMEVGSRETIKKSDSGVGTEISGIDTVDRYNKSKTTSRTPSPGTLKSSTKLERSEDTESVSKKLLSVYERLTSNSPLFSRKAKKLTSTKTVNAKDSKFPSKSDTRNKNVKKRNSSANVSSSKRRTLIREVPATSPEFPRRTHRKSSASPQFYVSDSERSASVLTVRPETISKPRTTSPILRTRDPSPASFNRKSSVPNLNRKPGRPKSKDLKEDSSKEFIRSSVSQFFSDQCEKALRDGIAEARNDVRSTETGKKPHLSRGSSPLSLRDMRTPTPTGLDLPRATIDRRRNSSTDSREIAKGGERSPEYFSYEPEKSSTNLRAGSPKLMDIDQKFRRESLGKSTKSFDSATLSKDTGLSSRRGSGTVLRSTKLIRDAIKRQSHENRGDYSSLKLEKSSLSSGTVSPDGNKISNASRRGSQDNRVQVDRKAEARPKTPEASQLECSPKNSTPLEVDVEIEEIAMSDQPVKQKQLRGTYSRSSNEASNVEKLFTYSVRKPTRKRGSLLESSVFEPSTRDEEAQLGSKCITPESLPSLTVKSETIDKRSTSEKRRVDLIEGNKMNLEGTVIQNLKSTECRKWNRSSPTNESKDEGPKRRTGKGVVNGKAETKVSKSKNQSSNNTRRDKGNLISKTYDRKSTTPTSSSPTNDPILPLSKQKMIKDNLNRKSQIKTPVSRELTPSPLSRKSGSNLKKMREDCNKRRTPSPQVSKQAEILRSMELVRLAMKGSTIKEPLAAERVKISGSNFQLSKATGSLVHGREETTAEKYYERTDSVESALKRFDSIGGESVRSTLGRSRDTITERRLSEQRTVCLQELDPPNINPRREASNSRPPSRSSRRSSVSVENEEGEKSQRQKKLAKARDSIEIARLANAKSTIACKRKLFQDADSGEETESGSGKSRRSEDSLERGPAIRSSKDETPESVCSVSTQFEYASGYASTVVDKVDKDETGSTGVDRSSLSVKQLRSIEDIRKSIEESPTRESAIVKNATRRINVGDRAGNKRGTPLAGRSVNRPSTVNCTMRFFRVPKSPSPDVMAKLHEANGRARRNVPPSPSKSPDMVLRRPSSELKGQDTKPMKRPTPVKSMEPIGNRKATTTTAMSSTTARKSTDVVDGAILENGLHLRGQTAETKYENESTAAKKSDAFVIDFDEQPPKENDTPLPRKSLLRKQFSEKQISSSHSTRPHPSNSSASSGNFVQSQTSSSRSKMASKSKTPVSAKTSPSKSGGSASCTDHLVPCKICSRRFAQDRVGLHEQICAKTGEKKRKQFNTVMHRVRGTDLEPFVKKALVCKPKPEKLKKPEIKSNWRRKHEDFIAAIRAAKQVQAHLAAGGKLSDLPPPPVSDNCDYIQCPHCGRKFNKAAADRHIPKCEHMLHNKPAHMRVPKPKR